MIRAAATLLLAVLAAGCSPRVEPPVAQAAEAKPVPAQAQNQAPAPAPAVAQQDDALPGCGDARVHELVKEEFIRRVLVEGDRALIERGALDPAEAFSEAEIVDALPRMAALARLEQVAEASATSERRRCAARLAADGWTDLQPPASFQITAQPAPTLFGVESTVQLLPGPEGFNMLIAYRSTFGKKIRQ